MQHSFQHRQPEAEVEEVLMAMPSFRISFSGVQEGPSLVLGYVHELDEGENEEEEFEFGSASREYSFDGLEPVGAEVVFSDGCIRPVYPLFQRSLVLDQTGGKPEVSAEEIRDGGDGECDSAAGAIGLADESIDFCLSFRDFMTIDQGSSSTLSSSSSGSWESPDDVCAAPAESVCVSPPVPSPPSSDHLSKKGQSARAFPVAYKKWRLLNLVSRRSRGDGKERFLLVAASAAEASKNKDKKKGKALPAAMPTSAAGEEKKEKAEKGGAKPPVEMDMSAAHRLYYAKGGAAAGDRRRSFLPYRKDLFGLFAHVNSGASTPTKFSPKLLFKFF